MGTIPPTALLLTINSLVVGEFKSYGEIAALLNVQVSDDGKVTVRNVTDTVGYDMSQFTKEEAIKNFAGNRMHTVIAPLGYRIYRYLT